MERVVWPWPTLDLWNKRRLDHETHFILLDYSERAPIIRMELYVTWCTQWFNNFGPRFHIKSGILMGGSLQHRTAIVTKATKIKKNSIFQKYFANICADYNFFKRPQWLSWPRALKYKMTLHIKPDLDEESFSYMLRAMANISLWLRCVPWLVPTHNKILYIALVNYSQFRN